MFRAYLIMALYAALLCGAEFAGKRISAVEGAPPALPLETRAGDLLDPVKLQHDVHTLWASARLADVQVEAVAEGEAVRVIFRLQEKTPVRVRKVHVEPPTPGVRVALEPGADMDWRGAEQVAAGIRKQLASEGYPDATAQARLVPVAPGVADLEVDVDKRRPVDIGSVTFSGELGVPAADLHHALRATRIKTMVPGIPGLWKGWHIAPGYNSDAVQADLAALRSFYYRRGYFDAGVTVDSVDFAGRKARVAFAVQSGRRSRIAQLNGVPLENPSGSGVDAVCRQLFNERRAAERTGVLDFAARLELEGAGGLVDAATRVTAGPAYRIGRIEFRGNHHFSDASLRRTLLLDEDAPLDQTRLRQSLARLNRNGWFEPVTESSVVVSTRPGSDRAGVLIALKEKKTRNWSFSGPVGPMSMGGPLRFAIGSHLPAWGRGAVELSTYTLSLNLMLFAKPIGALIPFLPNRRFIQLVTVERPLLPGQRLLSGFTIAPQLGWQGMLAGYGISQTRNFLQGLLATERGVTPDLMVTVAQDGREGVLRCEPPQPRLNRLRQVAGAAVNVLFSFSPL